MSPVSFMSPAFPILPTIFSNLLCSFNSSTTAIGCVPDPFATLMMRDKSLSRAQPFLQSNSSSVMLSIIVIKRFIRCTPCFSYPGGRAPGLTPGSIDMSVCSDPILVTYCNCSYMSRSEKQPFDNRCIISGCLSKGITSLISRTSPDKSPRPHSRLTKDCALKGSKSSKCSPVPMKIIGEFVAATAERAPPPLAWPSNFVIITLPTRTESAKALAWSKQACPMCESMTKTALSGWIASWTCSISSKRAASCLCLPLVSTMMSS
mmetsp:Transcript_36143/g.90963  ORF Transcript_36143/g.90963 Transcript_36143/m.90963 type:complete len:263 (-) Transcript_36143:713-1501(-)